MQPYSLTTAIDYVNAAPHIGHAYEKIAADVMCRFQRLMGRPVFFLTGTDEHGGKVEKTAKQKGITPKAHADELVEEFKKAWKYLNISYDRFIRTTEPDHYRVVESLWRQLRDRGDIYKKRYEGLYCSGCEKFVTARDLDEAGLCPHHQRKPDVVSEENYFFRLSQYKTRLQDHMKAHPDFVAPAFRATEVLQTLEELEDISVSRNKDSVSWGIPVPDDDEQVIYVWIDALSNYITGMGYLHNTPLFEKFWPAHVHLIGKDILRFHAIYWPAMLMSADLPLPRQIFAHGFINVNEAKISKSIGNVVSPFTLQERFQLPNSDPIRYYLMTVTSFGQDGSFTEDDFKLRINADLSNNLGNLLNRTLTMTGKYFEGKVPQMASESSPEVIAGLHHEAVIQQVQAAYELFDFQRAAELTLSLVDGANKQINDQEPWTLFKEGKLEELALLMRQVLETLRQTAIMLSSITPVLSDMIWMQLGYTTPLSASSLSWDTLLKELLPSGQTLQLQGPLLPRLDSELAGSSKKK